MENTTEKPLTVYQCETEKCKPSHDYGPQVRDHYLIHYVVSGKGIFRVNGIDYNITAGQCFIIFPGIVTYYRADDEDPWEYFWVGFNGADARNISEKCGFSIKYPVIGVSDTDRMLSCLKRLRKCYFKCPDSFETLSVIYEYFSLLDRSSGGANERNEENIIGKATDYINCSYSYDISVEQIARHVGLCRSQLFRVFKAALGVSPQEYVVRFRMSSAYALLVTTDLSVTEIMYSVGYRNINNFSKMFKKYYGHSPAKIRKSGLRPEDISIKYFKI